MVFFLVCMYVGPKIDFLVSIIFNFDSSYKFNQVGCDGNLPLGGKEIFQN